MSPISNSGAKSVRFLAAIGLVLLLSSPVLLLWASRAPVMSSGGDAMNDALERSQALQLAAMQLPEATARPAEYAAFGPDFDSPRIDRGRHGLLVTHLGSFDPRNRGAFMDRVPAALKFKGQDVTPFDRGTLRQGLNYVRIATSARAAGRGAEVQAAVARVARVIEYLPDGWLLVHATGRGLGELRQLADLSDYVAMEPAFKTGAHVGRRPRINRSEATSPVLRLEVFAVSFADAAKVRHELERVPGVESVAEIGPNAFEVRAHFKSVGKIGHLEDVLWVDETPEYMTMNAKNAPTVQAGSLEDTLGIRPFDDAGVDGGGIDTSGDGQRINNGSDAVPPQLVGIIDNGISMDVASFSQTATQVTDLAHPIGVTHRKVHFVIPLSGASDSCDSVLSGSGTHGNRVASIIAAYPTQLGVFYTKSQSPGRTRQPRNSNLDGVARGARIIMTDAATTAVCNFNSLVERGGNVNPGLLSERLNQFICPKSGGVGPLCSGVTGGANEIHLAVTPFGLPANFSNTQFPDTNGTYPESAADLDTFLYNNRDFMVMAPVGNSGGLLSSARLELVLDIVPHLFNGTTADDCTPDAQQVCQPDPLNPIQVAPPATAKNIVAVGAHSTDCVTNFATSDCQMSTADFSSRGPATPQSLRQAPIVTAPGSDLIASYETTSMASFRSNDNDNTGTIVNTIDETNYGTSYAAANATAAGALIRDYFAQGFYPTAARQTANRLPNISGALVKALLIASAKFSTGADDEGHSDLELRLERSRGFDQGSFGNQYVGIMGNSYTGYGRILLTDALPLANWPKSFVVDPNTLPEFPAHALLVYDDVATGEPLLGNDAGAASCTAGATSCTHEFRVDGAQTGLTTEGGRAVFRAELRVALAWPDVPSLPDSGGPLVNDLDLVVESPGQDNCLGEGYVKFDGTVCGAGTEADNLFYDGNNYVNLNSFITGQWSVLRPVGEPEVHDFRNPHEAVHLNSDPDRNFGSPDPARFNDSSLLLGTWRVTVKRGCGGSLKCLCTGDPATEGNICYGNDGPCGTGTCAPGALSAVGGANEDLNGNRRLDPGEDVHDGAGGPPNGLLDLGGQAYALAIAGPVFRLGPPPAAGPTSFPASQISLDRFNYDCASDMRALLTDSTGGSTALASASTTFTVQTPGGSVLDTEVGIAFSSGASPGTYASGLVPVRQAGATRTSFNGILEAGTGELVAATYAPAGQAAVTGSAVVRCAPDFIPGFFAFIDNNSFGDQITVGNGCDNDEHFDAGETLTYGIGINNRSRTDDYADVMATLSPSGPGAAAVRVLDSPVNVGRIPGNGFQGLFFHIFVDPAIANALPADSRKVTMTLTLNANSHGKQIGTQTYNFLHAINADTETFHYSTDLPAGGRQVRDLNRNLLIDTPDAVDPFLQIVMADEDVTFSSMFVPGDAAGRVTNILGEDLDGDGTRDPNEADIIPDGQLNRGILFQASGPSTADRAPFHFDNGDGGFVPIRHPQSQTTAQTNPVWEYKTSGLCGFQTALDAPLGQTDIFGIWHTGDSDPNSPSPTATTCDNHAVAKNPQTQNNAELYFDVLHSPIIAKVRQQPDALGFPFEVAFQRFGVNFNMQVNNAYAGGAINIDNDADSDSINCLMCQDTNIYYTRRYGGWAYYQQFTFGNQYFDAKTIDAGIDPASVSPFQRTFGPFADGDGSVRACVGGIRPGEPCVTDAECPGGPGITPGICDPDSGQIPGVMDLTGDESGFSGFTQDSNVDSESPIPTAAPDFIPYPLAGAPVPGVCTGGTTPGAPCQADQDCSGGGTCALANNSNDPGDPRYIEGIAGPTRNFDTTLVNYEGGAAHEVLAGRSAPEEFFFWEPGRAGNRWLIGLGFFSIESNTGLADYGFGVDDVVLEWDESHPGTESTPACSKFGGIGQPAGAQCATITVDRSSLYECEESLLITVVDPTAATPTIDVQIVTDSDSVLFATQRFAVFQPNNKVYTLGQISTTPPTYQASIVVSSATNNDQTVNPGQNGNVFTNPGTDGSFIVYYRDPDCDADADGATAENLFANYDGDGVAPASDNCPFTYNPLQENADGDHLGDLCDNCPNADTRTCVGGSGAGSACLVTADCPGVGASCVTDQADDNEDGTGDVCENDDVDFDGLPEDGGDNCPGRFQETTRDADLDGRGDACDGAVCVNSPTTSCVADTDCPLRCSNSATRACVDPAANCARSCDGRPTTTCTQDSNCAAVAAGVCTDLACVGGLRNGLACATDNDCPGAAALCVSNQTTCTVPGDCRGLISAFPDADADGEPDTTDNCILISNPNQRNADNDRLGDLCDGDCTGGSFLFFCANRQPRLACTSSADCGGYCLDNPDIACAAAADCPNGGSCRGDICQPILSVSPSETCSTANDDLDVDGVADVLDNCPTVVNTSIIPGTDRQRDSDRDGLGDECDPAGTFDDDFDGVPDDILTFTGGIACRTLQLASFSILSAEYRDMDGDHDIFPDPGETGIVVLTLRNDTRNATNFPVGLSGASFTVTSTDSDVDCITLPTIFRGTVNGGEVFTLGVLPDTNGQGGSGFTFRTSNATATLSPADPARTELCMTASANETLGTSAPVCFRLGADLDFPVGVTQVFTLGPNGIDEGGGGDDGTILENFDIDKDGDGNITVNDLFLQPDGKHAHYIYSNASGEGDEPIDFFAGIPCGGFADPAVGNDACVVHTGHPMDWHVHCAPGATNCPNLESGSGNSVGTGACVGGCSYRTPANGLRAFSGNNSMHVGAHFDLGNEQAGDTTHFRSMQGFATAPVNLALIPRPGDLELSMFHIANLIDNAGVGGGRNRGQCSDCGDVQVRVDLDISTGTDAWGAWDKLVPFQNVYDHKGMSWSAFADYYCLFTPADTPSDVPPAPRGKKETMCFPLGLFSRCGTVRGTTPAAIGLCLDATGMPGTGRGFWVETKFNLAGYLGQRIQVRWTVESWVFDATASSYYEAGGVWATRLTDDGWWLDDIRFTGTITEQLTPPADIDPPVAGSCPAGCNTAVGDNGTAPSLRFTDLADNQITTAAVGQTIRVHAGASTIPGGCQDAVPQFQFRKNGIVVQDYSGKAFYQDEPLGDATYNVLVRCGSDFDCTSATGATATLGVYVGQGDDTDLPLTLTHLSGTTTINWPSRAQVAPMSGFNLYRGTRTDDGLATTPSAPDTALTTLVQHACNVPPGALNATLSRTDAANPAAHSLTYYLVGHRHGGGAPTGLGRRSDGSVRYSPAAVTCP